jgi:hypothetical protein
MLRDTDESEEEEGGWDDDDFEAAMEEALAFFAFMCGVLTLISCCSPVSRHLNFR